MSFQKTVNQYNPIAVEGDFASANPRATVLASEGGLVAGPFGVIVGRFAWLLPSLISDTDASIVTSFGQGGLAPAGFVHRDQQGLLTRYLQESTMTIPAGFPVILHNAGDFFAKVNGQAATVGATIYARYSDGAIFIGAVPTGASVTGAIGSTNTAAIGSTFTATASGANLTTTSVTGVISVGDVISGTGVPAGTTILSQTSGTAGGAGVYVTSVATTASSATVTSFGPTLVVSSTTGLISVGDTVSGGAGFPTAATVVSQTSGTAGGAGTYVISAPATAYVASATGVTTFGTVLNVTAIGSGTLAVGEAISGTGIPAGASIESLVSGTPGGIAVYTINTPASAYAASTTITVVAGILTKFVAKSVAAVGELVKISTWGN